MGVKATELRKGQVIEKDGDLMVITEYEHRTPGNLRAIINIKIRSLSTGQTIPLRLSSSDTLEVAYLDRRKCEYLYKESSGDCVFMDNESYEQFHLSQALIGEKMGYVKENTTVEVTFHNQTPIDIALPKAVELDIIQAEDAVKGNTATNVKKDAVLETGLAIKVPLHIGVGDKVRVSTETGEFLGRAN
jgi:elongation factor P